MVYITPESPFTFFSMTAQELFLADPTVRHFSREWAGLTVTKRASIRVYLGLNAKIPHNVFVFGLTNSTQFAVLN